MYTRLPIAPLAILKNTKFVQGRKNGNSEKRSLLRYMSIVGIFRFEEIEQISVFLKLPDHQDGALFTNTSCSTGSKSKGNRETNRY